MARLSVIDNPSVVKLLGIIKYTENRTRIRQNPGKFLNVKIIFLSELDYVINRFPFS